MNIGKVLESWYAVLNGNVTVPVYSTDVPEEENGNYVYFYAESGSGRNSKSSKMEEVVIICQVVTQFENNINPQTVETIDALVEGLIIPTASTNGLRTSSGINFSVERDGFDYVQEDDGVKKYYRKVSTYRHFIS